MTDVSLYPKRVYRNADPLVSLKTGRPQKTIKAWTADTEKTVQFRNKSEVRTLSAYCNGMDNTCRYATEIPLAEQFDFYNFLAKYIFSDL